MAKLAIEVEVDEISCAVCGRAAEVIPTSLQLFHRSFTEERQGWQVVGYRHPDGWKAIGGKDLCPVCWESFQEFAAQRKPNPPIS